MKTQLDNECIKIWFHTGTSRNLAGVTEIRHEGNLMCIVAQGKEYLVNFAQVTMIEPLGEGDTK